MFSLLAVFYSPPVFATPTISKKECIEKSVKGIDFTTDVTVIERTSFSEFENISNYAYSNSLPLIQKRYISSSIIQISKPPLKVNRIRADLIRRE
jgi:hypothetical protein